MDTCWQCGSWCVASHNHRKAIGRGYSATMIIVDFNHIFCPENISDTCPCGSGYQTCIILSCIAFSALTLVVGRQEERPVCKNWVLRCWCGYLSGASADCLHLVQLMPLHPKTPSSLASFESRLVLPFWCWLTQVVLENRPLNGYSSGSSSIIFVMWLDWLILERVVCSWMPFYHFQGFSKPAKLKITLALSKIWKSFFK